MEMHPRFAKRLNAVEAERTKLARLSNGYAEVACPFCKLAQTVRLGRSTRCACGKRFHVRKDRNTLSGRPVLAISYQMWAYDHLGKDTITYFRAVKD
jgi:hypothetical protein